MNCHSHRKNFNTWENNRSVYCAHFSIPRDSQKHTTRPLGVHISLNLRCPGTTKHAARDRLLDEPGTNRYPTAVQRARFGHIASAEALSVNEPTAQSNPINVCTCFFINSGQGSAVMLNNERFASQHRYEPPRNIAFIKKNSPFFGPNTCALTRNTLKITVGVVCVWCCDVIVKCMMVMCVVRTYTCSYTYTYTYTCAHTKTHTYTDTRTYT